MLQILNSSFVVPGPRWQQEIPPSFCPVIPTTGKSVDELFAGLRDPVIHGLVEKVMEKARQHQDGRCSCDCCSSEEWPEELACLEENKAVAELLRNMGKARVAELKGRLYPCESKEEYWWVEHSFEDRVTYPGELCEACARIAHPNWSEADFKVLDWSEADFDVSLRRLVPSA